MSDFMKQIQWVSTFLLGCSAALSTTSSACAQLLPSDIRAVKHDATGTPIDGLT
jgi:hypothetical protein